MIAVNGTLYRLYANLLRYIVQDWCGQNNLGFAHQLGLLRRKVLCPRFQTHSAVFTQAEAYCSLCFSFGT